MPREGKESARGDRHPSAPRNASSPALPASPCARVPGCSLPRLGASRLPPPPGCRPHLCLFAFGREVVPRESAVACEGPGSRGFEGESQAGRLNFPWNPEKTPEGPLGSAASLPLVPPAPPASLPDPQTCRSPASPRRRLLGWGADALYSRHPSRFYSHAAGGGCPLLSPPLLSQDSRCRAAPHVNRVCLDQHPHSPALPPARGLQRRREPETCPRSLRSVRCGPSGAGRTPSQSSRLRPACPLERTRGKWAAQAAPVFS